MYVKPFSELESISLLATLRQATRCMLKILIRDEYQSKKLAYFDIQGKKEIS